MTQSFYEIDRRLYADMSYTESIQAVPVLGFFFPQSPQRVSQPTAQQNDQAPGPEQPKVYKYLQDLEQAQRLQVHSRFFTQCIDIKCTFTTYEVL